MPDKALHTLAQLARRVGLSDGRVRAMWSTDREALPAPDAYDADGHPLWLPATVDQWDTLRQMSKSRLLRQLLDTGSLGEPAVVELARRIPGETLRRVVETAGDG